MQVDDRGEEELVGELLPGDLLEELVEDLGVHGVGHDALSHDRQRRILGEPLEDVAENHRCRLRGESVTPYLVAA
jgi:hypothetical protein